MQPEVKNKVFTFFRQFKFKKYKKGEILIHPTESPVGLFYLEEGVVRQYTISTTGEELVLNTFKAPAFFPVGWVLNNSPIRHSFEAMNDTAVWIVPKKEALLFLQTNSDVVFDLLQRIYKGLEGYFVRIENLMTGTARNKLLFYLLIHSKRFSEHHLKLTEDEIASGAGLSRETVSRQLQILKKEELVSFEKGVLRISNPSLLEKEIWID